jgi:hypothetical protein
VVLSLVFLFSLPLFCVLYQYGFGCRFSSWLLELCLNINFQTKN